MTETDPGSPLLQIRYASLKLRNPFLLASGPPTNTAEMLDRAFAAGWAGAVIKTVPSPSLEHRGLTAEPRPLLAGVKVGARPSGMGNISYTCDWGLEQWGESLPGLKERHPGCVVLGSIGAEMRKDDWQSMAACAEQAGFDGVELDLSCSHATLGREVPLIVGENADLTAEVLRWVTAVVKIPIIPKLPASVRDWRGVLRACREAGAAGVAAINSLSALMGVDLETMEPQPSLRGFSTYCGYSGPAIKPIGLRVVSQMSKAGDLPISGIGGVTTWQDAAEFLLLGASCVQVCTAVMWSGYGIVAKMSAGLADYLERKGIESLQDLIGRANERVVDNLFDLEPDYGLTAFITERCNRCGRCVIACRDGAHQAIAAAEGGAPVVDAATCVGCGLCLLVCPVDAVELRP
jgi:dihydropyrimidine dehydrogenase (NAD+) subunit PreA